MSNKNNTVDYPGISREQRILLRAKRYAKGEITLDEFTNLERLDEAIEELESEQLNDKTTQQAKKLQGMYQEEKALAEAKAAKPKAGKQKKLDITYEEYNALPMYEQQQLYNQYPDEVKALIDKGRKSRYGSLV